LSICPNDFDNLEATVDIHFDFVGIIIHTLMDDGTSCWVFFIVFADGCADSKTVDIVSPVRFIAVVKSLGNPAVVVADRPAAPAQ
jgi:hypothetical protein